MHRTLAFAMRTMQGAEGVKWGIHLTFVIDKQTRRLWEKSIRNRRETNTGTTDLVILEIALPANPAQKASNLHVRKASLGARQPLHQKTLSVTLSGVGNQQASLS